MLIASDPSPPSALIIRTSATSPGHDVSTGDIFAIVVGQGPQIAGPPVKDEDGDRADSGREGDRSSLDGPSTPPDLSQAAPPILPISPEEWHAPAKPFGTDRPAQPALLAPVPLASSSDPDLPSDPGPIMSGQGAGEPKAAVGSAPEPWSPRTSTLASDMAGRGDFADQPSLPAGAAHTVASTSGRASSVADALAISPPQGGPEAVPAPPQVRPAASDGAPPTMDNAPGRNVGAARLAVLPGSGTGMANQMARDEIPDASRSAAQVSTVVPGDRPESGDESAPRATDSTPSAGVLPRTSGNLAALEPSRLRTGAATSTAPPTMDSAVPMDGPSNPPPTPGQAPTPELAGMPVHIPPAGRDLLRTSPSGSGIRTDHTTPAPDVSPSDDQADRGIPLAPPTGQAASPGDSPGAGRSRPSQEFASSENRDLLPEQSGGAAQEPAESALDATAILAGPAATRELRTATAPREPVAMTPHQATPPAEPHRQLADAIVRTRDGRTEILLDPAELGRVTVTLGDGDRPGQVGIQVERPETLDLLRRHGDQLVRDLRDSGLPDPRLDFHHRDNPGQGRHQHPQATAGRFTAPDPGADASRQAVTPPSGSRQAVDLKRLDIRM